MNTVENALLQQMQKMAASIAAMQGSVNKDKGNQAAVSFQDMLQQSGNKASSSEAPGKEPQDKPLKEVEEAVEEAKQPQLPGKDKEELKAENLTGNPNAIGVMELFRPEIVETAEQVEPVLNPIPEETVEGAAMDLGGQAPEMETSVDAGIGAEVSMEQQPKDFQQAMEEMPQQQDTETVQQPQQEASPHPVQDTEKPEAPVEVRVEQDGEGEEPTGEAAAAEQPVFRETQSTPVKVGERYETVDTQKPDMEAKLADTIRQAAQTGTERVEIRLTPANLGAVTIEMTKDASGALQVVLHAANSRAAGLLQQHLDGLHTALQSYGAGQEVHVEVQRNQDSQQQHFQQADPDGRGQQQRQRQQEERQDNPSDGQDFIQKLRLGLFGTEETI